LTSHVAESEPEFDMFMHRRGPLFDWLQSQRDMSDCGDVSPVRHLERCGYLSENLLAVHANYLAPGDAELFAMRKTSVVHCPSSHAYFGHQRFPDMELAKAGVNLCLGTDSLASASKLKRQFPELSMLREMHGLSEQRPELAPATILQMATMRGAVALGRRGEVGELAPRALADMVVIPFAGRRADAEQAVVHFDEKVAGSMIGGSWVVPASGSA
jgi:cytosine/adenosine deaminase-related metal-dependent hydrolase